MSDKRADQLFDISKLSESSLRKYQSYFKISASDSQLRQKVSDHLNNHLQVDPNDVIQKLLELRREEKGKGRGMRPARGGN